MRRAGACEKRVTIAALALPSANGVATVSGRPAHARHPGTTEFMRNFRLASTLAAIFAIAACGTAKPADSSGTLTLADSKGSGDTSIGDDVKFPSKDAVIDVSSGSDAPTPGSDADLDTDSGPDGSGGTDTAAGSDASADSDTGTTTGCEFPANSLQGEPGTSCTSNADCDSGYCVDSPTGKICSMACSNCCPTGFHCSQIPGSSDTTYICLAQFIALCRPCSTDAECGALNAGSLCVNSGDSGSFCGGACDKDADCPGGYGCQLSQGEKGAGKQCVRLSGECSCSQKAIFDGATTNCANKNSFGSCAGTRKCAISGLTACSAQVPAQEICNGKDDNCDGLTDGSDSADCVNYWKDGDGDGAGVGASQCTCAPVGMATATTNGDCNDDNAAVHPGAKEICNDIDDNCDGVTDEGCDKDGDGYCDAAMVIVGSPVVCKYGIKDCNDNDPNVHPNAPEICGNGIDDDCNGVTDDNASTTFYLDSDGDGFGNPKVTQQACAKPAGYVTIGGDCDDNNAAVHPGAAEICNGIDDDCDGVTDGVDLSGCTPFFTDNDGDGVGAGSSSCLCKASGLFTATVGGDCDDTNASIHPGAVELCNGVDDNCNGVVDEPGAGGCTLFYPDADGDGYGAIVSGVCLCAADGLNKATKSGDCNDASPAIHPKADEICNGIDDDCDGVTDPANAEGCSNFYLDGDGDGFGTASGGAKCLCAASSPYTALLAGDCDDTAKTTYPGAPEICNGIDDNCNGVVDEGVTTLFYVDADGDGYGAPSVSVAACTAPPGYVADNTDCDGSKASVHPGAAEICNGIDDNCDGVTDPAGSGGCTTFYADVDLDGYGDKTSAGQCLCKASAPYTATTASDCNDGSASVHPGATEICNGIDDNCNGMVDEGVGQLWYQDGDGDGYGNSAVSVQACSAPAGYVSDHTDCDDTRAYVHPGAAEVCNGLDDNCNGAIDDGVTTPYYQDNDGDGFGSGVTAQACSAPAGYVSVSGDCNDANGAIHPGATEICNGVDDNCDGQIDEGVKVTYYQDNDGDGYGSGITTQACSKPAGYVAVLNGDCNDANAAIHPGATEICNGLDDNCNGQTDEGLAFTTYYQDLDLDGYGNPAVSKSACSQPAGYVLDHTDCLDTNASVPGPIELCGPGNAPNGVDENCNGQTDEGCTAVSCAARALEDFHSGSGCTVSGWTGGGWCRYGGYGEGGFGMGYYAISGYPKTNGTTASSTAKYDILAGDKFVTVDVMMNNALDDYGTIDPNAKITMTVSDGTTAASAVYSSPSSLKYKQWFPLKVAVDPSWVGKKVSVSVNLVAPKPSYATNQGYTYAGFGFDMLRITCN